MNKDTLEWNDIIPQIDLTDTYRVFHHATAQYIFFLSSPWNFLQNTSYLGHEACLNKYKKIEITPWRLSDNYNAIKLELNNNKRNSIKCQHLETE
jgi:hypothetical protein